MWCEVGSARLDCDTTEARCSRLGLATVWRRRMGGGENTGYDSSGLGARASSDSNEMRRGSRYASSDTVMSADDGEGGAAGRGAGAGRAGDGGADGSLSGVWKPRGEAGLSGVW